MPRSILTTACALLLVALTAACDDTETPTGPTLPPPTVTDTFTGNLTSNGAATHNFAVAAAGTVTATLKSLGADDTLVVGFSLGTWNGTTCSIVLAKDDATVNFVHTGAMTNTGNLCVRIYDVGNIPAGTSVPYSIDVVHP